MKKYKLYTFAFIICVLAISRAEAQVRTLSPGTYTFESSFNETLNVGSGVTVTDNIGVYTNGVLNMSDGAVGDDIRAFDNGIIIFSGGTVGDDIRTYDTSSANISGGSIGDDVRSYGNSNLSISGGTIDNDIRAFENSTVNITGGTITDEVRGFDNSTVSIAGGSILGAGTQGGEFDPVSLISDGRIKSFGSADFYIYASDFGSVSAGSYQLGNLMDGLVTYTYDNEPLTPGGPLGTVTELHNSLFLDIVFADASTTSLTFQALNQDVSNILVQPEKLQWQGTLHLIDVDGPGVIVPEPATNVMILSLAVFSIACYRRKRTCSV